MRKKHSIGFSVRMLSNLIQREADNAMQELLEGLTFNQCRVLCYLSHHSERDVFQRELEERFNIRRSTVTQMLQLMEKRGLIERVAAEQDARQKRLLLTDKGRELYERGMQCLAQFNAKLCEDIADEELEAFQNTLEKLMENLQHMTE